MPSTPLLSICVPTYNGQERLPNLLNSVAKFFDNSEKPWEVQLVLSDNASEDNSIELMRQFATMYPDFVKVFSNEANVCEINFGLSLSRADGLYRKLIGDTFYFIEGAIQLLLETIRALSHSRPNLFLLNGNKPRKGFNFFDSTNDLLSYASFWITWIGFFGIWENQADGLKMMEHFGDTHLPQTHTVLALSSTNRSVTIDQRLILEIDRSANKNNLNEFQFIETFGDHYLGALNSSLNLGIINITTYQTERVLVLSEFIYKKLYTSEAFSSETFLPKLKNHWSRDEIIHAYDHFVRSRLR